MEKHLISQCCSAPDLDGTPDYCPKCKEPADFIEERREETSDDYVVNEYVDGWCVERPNPENISRLIHVQGPFPTEHDAEQWIKGQRHSGPYRRMSDALHSHLQIIAEQSAYAERTGIEARQVAKDAAGLAAIVTAIGILYLIF